MGFKGASDELQLKLVGGGGGGGGCGGSGGGGCRFRERHIVQRRAEYCVGRKRIPILLKLFALLIVYDTLAKWFFPAM